MSNKKEKNAITISDSVEVGDNSKFILKGVALSPDHPTILYIPTGDKPPRKAAEYIQNVGNQLNKKYGDRYEIILIAVRG